MVGERDRGEGERRRRSRNLPLLPNNSNSNSKNKALLNEEARSRSLPKAGGRNKSNPGERATKEKLRPAQSLALLVKPETVELPIIVDSTTKWISGVNANTTCQDLIQVLLHREQGEIVTGSHLKRYMVHLAPLFVCS